MWIGRRIPGVEERLSSLLGLERSIDMTTTSSQPAEGLLDSGTTDHTPVIWSGHVILYKCTGEGPI
jgi:hypothetical protein